MCGTEQIKREKEKERERARHMYTLIIQITAIHVQLPCIYLLYITNYINRRYSVAKAIVRKLVALYHPKGVV